METLFAWLKATPILNYVKAHELAYLKHVPITLGTILLMGFLGGFALKGCSGTRNLAFLTGQLTEREKEVSNLKADLGRVTTEKAAEVTKLTIEKAAAEQRLSYFEAMPANVMQLYSNISVLYTNDYASRPQLSSLLSAVQTISKSLAKTTPQPSFVLYLNGMPVTNYAHIPLNRERSLAFRIINETEFTADNLSMALGIHFPFQATNLVAQGWSLSPVGALSGNDEKTVVGNCWWWNARDPLEGNSFFDVERVVITNFTQHITPLEIRISASRSKQFWYYVLLTQ